jgi:hypothetical protein
MELTRGIRLFDPAAVKIVRYGYRGDRIPTPWTPAPRLGDAAWHDMWRAGWGEALRPLPDYCLTEMTVERYADAALIYSPCRLPAIFTPNELWSVDDAAT